MGTLGLFCKSVTSWGSRQDYSKVVLYQLRLSEELQKTSTVHVVVYMFYENFRFVAL